MRVLSGIRLDLKIGVRMISRHPGLSVLACLAMAVAIGICTGAFELVTQIRRPDLGLTGGDRLVAIQILDRQTARPRRPFLDEFAAWRGDLRSVDEVSAFRTEEPNLVLPKGPAGPVAVAEISASGMRLAGVAPELGRLFGGEDERRGAPAVALVGHDLWQARFGADRDIVGRGVTIGGESVTVIGVMPAGFEFPVNQSVWMPLRAPASASSAVSGGRRAVWTMGRLAPGASIATAQAELTTILSRTSPATAESGAEQRSRVIPYAQAFIDFSSVSASSTNLFAWFFLLLMCANVALLLFVRVAMRSGEIVVRTALGATRGRIVTQLVAESVSLALLGVLAGIGLGAFGLRSGIEAFQLIEGRGLPYWVTGHLSLRSIVYAVGLAVACAVMTGGLPALSATRGGLRARLSDWGVNGAAMRLGRIWSFTMIAQVALVVAYVPIFLRFGLDAHQISTTDLGVDGSQYLVADIRLDGEPRSVGAAFAALKERLKAQPGIAGVTFASARPGESELYRRRIEVDGRSSARPTRVYSEQVDLDYFEALGVTVLAGRAFRAGDLESGAPIAVVNQSFVQRVLGRRNAIGQRIRYAPERIVVVGADAAPQDAEPWYEIVGVVRDVRFSLDPSAPDNVGVYHLGVPGPASPTALSTPELNTMVVRVSGSPYSYSSPVREAAAVVDPALRLSDVEALDDLRGGLLRAYSSGLRLASLVGGLAALLAVSGVFSVLSYTVSRRTREIGIRVALGAGRRHIVSVVCARLLEQLALGVVAGGVVLVIFDSLVPSRLTGVPLLTVSALLLFGAGLAACAGPVGRALRVDPVRAIVAEG